MKRISYAIYPPPLPGRPWLAVVLEGDKPIDTFGCPDEESAERVLAEMEARVEGRSAAAFA
jgi:hypothetical protein